MLSRQITITLINKTLFMSTLLKLKKVNLKYQTDKESIKVLKDIDLTTKKKDTISIVGESGSGKTSLIMLIGGLEKATSGKIFFQDQEITALSEDEVSEIRRKHIGIVFQSFYLIPSYTALENVSLALEINFEKKAKEQAETLLVELGLQDRLHHFPSQLSGGEQQRVAIARAMINKPPLILADEPTGNLDEENSLLISNLLLQVSLQYQQSLCLVTHDLDLAKKCDRIIQIENGKLL